jgi:hypothetical protein
MNFANDTLQAHTAIESYNAALPFIPELVMPG